MAQLAAQLPELPREQIDRAIRGCYAGFDNSRIRNFLPVLVERRVRNDLAGR